MNAQSPEFEALNQMYYDALSREVSLRARLIVSDRRIVELEKPAEAPGRGNRVKGAAA